MSADKHVIFTAAHAGFPLERVALGGGGTLATWLERDWSKTKAVSFELLTPALLGASAPREKDLIRYSELRYARFCRDFEQATTERILKSDPSQTIVLCNDVSEGPDFKRLAEAGFPVFTIYHVDVVDYFCRIYLREYLSPERATALHRRWERSMARRLFPDLLKLIFKKQADSARYSRGLIVMSRGMQRMLLAEYPFLPPGRVHLFPWGLPPSAVTDAERQAAQEELKTRYPLTRGSKVLLTLSRITPEKGQDRLLEALALWESRADYPQEGITVFMTGEAAYMQGQRFEKRLRYLASRLRRTTVYFPGYCTGPTKEALFALADLYVFPSRHESYGLTLLEAMRAGLPVLSTPTYGAADMVRPEFGTLLPEAAARHVPQQIQRALSAMLADPARLKKQGQAAAAYAKAQRFEDTAARLAALLSQNTAK